MFCVLDSSRVFMYVGRVEYMLNKDISHFTLLYWLVDGSQ